jgi:hypothetical protein
MLNIILWELLHNIHFFTTVYSKPVYTIGTYTTTYLFFELVFIIIDNYYDILNETEWINILTSIFIYFSSVFYFFIINTYFYIGFIFQPNKLKYIFYLYLPMLKFQWWIHQKPKTYLFINFSIIIYYIV